MNPDHPSNGELSLGTCLRIWILLTVRDRSFRGKRCVSSSLDCSLSHQKPQGDIKEGDIPSQIWKLYGAESDKYDRALVEGWKGHTDSMLILTGLFSAVVSAFLIETYKTLQPDSGTQTVTLLAQLVAQ
ncbi:hypothetical protein BC834DRAFT_834322, partial [Gloeopeniophorella convolvens]